MLRLVLSTFLILAVAPALAYCPAVPDGPYSYNVQYGTQLALCQQGELTLEAERIRRERMIESLTQDLDQQRLELRQNLPVLPPLPKAAF